MDLNHDSLVWLSKSIGLLYLVGLSVVIVAYAYWPSNWTCAALVERHWLIWWHVFRIEPGL